MNCAPPPQTCSHYPVGSSTKQESQELRKPPQKCSHCPEESSTKQESKGLKARLQMCSHYSVGSPTKQCGILAVYPTSNIQMSIPHVTYQMPVLLETLTESVERHEEDDSCDVLEKVDPFLALTLLSRHVYHSASTQK